MGVGMVDGQLLADAGELAGLMGLRDAQVVLDLRRHPVGFPEPVGRRNRALVWSWHDVELWGRVHAGMLAGGLGAALAAFLESVA